MIVIITVTLIMIVTDVGRETGTIPVTEIGTENVAENVTVTEIQEWYIQVIPAEVHADAKIVKIRVHNAHNNEKTGGEDFSLLPMFLDLRVYR